jgi:uncharacterized lipoprotein YmbA
MRAYTDLLLASLVWLPLALGGCAEDAPTRFYVLSNMGEETAAIPGKGIAVGVGPITIPQYLNRPQIVTRISSNQLALAEFDQWGGDLNDNVTRALAVDLSSLLKTDRVSLYPWGDEVPIEYQVTVNLTNFEEDVDGSSLLSVFWTIVNPKNNKVMLMRRSSYRDTGATTEAGASGDAGTGRVTAARSYDAFAAAMSRNLEALSRDIAVAITGLKGT